MIPFRKNVALAIDGGGIRGVIVTKALTMLEQALGQPVHQVFRLACGTSTGSIISAAIGAKLSAADLNQLYVDLGDSIFTRTWRTTFFPLTRYRYKNDGLAIALKNYMGDRTMGSFWTDTPPTDVVITTFDLVDNHTRFIKPWKDEYKDWPVTRAVLASSTVPTYFPVVEGRYVDGGVGAYANPCYLAAYEARFCLNWDPAETTLISLGTGRDPHKLAPGQASRYYAWNWLEPVLGAFLQSADDQQVQVVHAFFDQLDFRRFQVSLNQAIGMDDPSMIPQLTGYGEQLGNMILNDITENEVLPMAARVPGV